MAHVNVTDTSQGEIRPLQNAVLSPMRNRTNDPFAQLVHMGSTALTAIGVGDTEDFILKMALPEGFVYKLRNFYMHVTEATGIANSWRPSTFKMPYRINPGGVQQVIQYPMIVSEVNTHRAAPVSTDVDRFFYLGGNDNSGSAAADNAHNVNDSWGPFGQYVRSEAASSNPQCQIVNFDDASDGPWTLTFYAVWDQFNIEQAEWSALAHNVP